MALNPSSQYTAANELMYKTPMYTAAFQTKVGTVKFTVSDVAGTGPILWLEQADETWTAHEWIGYTAVITASSGEQYTRTIGDNDTVSITFNYSLSPGSVKIGDIFRIDFYTEFCTYQPAEDTFDLKAPRKPYISYISGGGYSISPDEGSASSATIKIEMQDKDNEVTDMIHNATGRLQKKCCIVKAGYVGLKESEMLTIFTGEVTDYSYNKEGVWAFSVSDTIRALNKYLFRGAGDYDPDPNIDKSYVIEGNPINLILQLLISEDGDGTRGIYDRLPSGYGLGLSPSLIDIGRFEEIRNIFYPGTSVKFKFIMDGRQKATDFLSEQFFKPLNMYPIILGDGRFSARIYRPVLPPYSAQTLTEDEIIDIPEYQGNLTDLINEVQFSYDNDPESGDFMSIDVFSDAVSINERGVGDRTLEIECQGLDSNFTDADDFLIRSANRIFERYSNPPIKLSITTFYKNALVEAGDILSVSNKFLPNLATGLFDFEFIQMEVIKRTVDWKRGSVRLDLLQTGYEQENYAGISPILEVASDVAADSFVAVDVNDYVAGFKVTVWRPHLDVDTSGIKDLYSIKKIEDDIEIISVNTSTNEVTTDSLATGTYQVGDIVTFNDTADLTDYQKAWGYITATGDPDPYLITP